jgi:class 3 adenylate cyclase
VLGLVLAFFITRNLVQPVRRLLTGTRAVEGGDLSVQIQASSADEIAALTESFNTMVAGLREKERIRDTFGQYVDPRIVSGLLENRIAVAGGEKKNMTVFFSDLVGFTSLCEHLSPEGVVRLLNRYFTLMSEPIREQHGILDKFIGDAIMAYWGPPFTGEREHAALACAAALDSRARLDAFRAMLPEITGLRKGIPEIGVRMGLASGDVTIGNIGSDTVKGFTVIGDHVNLASRLEGANKEYGTWILMSEDTRRLAGDAIEAREIDAIRVLGKSEPVRIFELVGRKGDPNPLREPYEAALASYRAGDFNAAEEKFRSLGDDPPSKIMLTRIAYLRQHPETRRADGVWDLTKK